MKYRFSAVGYRILACVLAAVCLVGGYLSAMSVITCLDLGLYSDGWVYQTSDMCRQRASQLAESIIMAYQDNPDYNRWNRLLENTDLRFLIVDEATGDVKTSYLDGLDMKAPRNLKDNIYMQESRWTFELGEEGDAFENVYVADWYFGNGWTLATSEYVRIDWEISHENATEPFESYQLLLLLPQTLTKRGNGDSIWEGYQIIQTLWQYRNTALVILGMSLVMGLACLIFLLCQVGHRPGEACVQLGWMGRVPLEFPLGAGFLAALVILAVVDQGMEMMNNAYLSSRELEVVWGLFSLAAAGCGSIVLCGLSSAAAWMKHGEWWNGLLTWRVLKWCCGKLAVALRWLWAMGLRCVRSIGIVPRAAMTLIGILLMELLLILWLVYSWERIGPLTVLALYNLALLLGLIWAAGQMKILQIGAKALANGDLEHQVNTQKMYWDFKQHGENLNAISIGMAKAVEKQMRSERLKTELITNVSHDIKTPLTSIVNYVDLLQKTHSEAEQARYLEVLERQSKRLKRLTENLVEASKASTGNMAVHLEPLNVMELVNQAVEEYRDRMEAGRLETVVSLRGDLMVRADGKLMWRVLDNLLNNVIKYALAGTRVYVTAEKWDKQVVIAIKNISRDPLNVNADELMERFVRGDSSRHTEGSGLGLNIARSLTQLQHGEFRLTVDGDLFKAEVSLQVAE